jgi:hypothetical protein
MAFHVVALFTNYLYISILIIQLNSLGFWEEQNKIVLK